MKDKTFVSYERRLLVVLNYIGTHLDNTLPLDELAKMACFSPYHFHRVFTGMMGETLKEYVRRLRLERAALQLASDAVPVTNIAFDAGYESHEAFTRAFRAAFGLSPSAYRTQAGGTGIEAPSGVHYEKCGVVSHLLSQKEPVMDVSIKHIDPVRIAYVSHVGPYDEVGQAWGALYKALFFRMLIGGRKPKCFGIVYDDPDVTDPAKIRYDACVKVSEKYRPGKGVGARTLDGGDYAVTVHKGPYNEVGKMYAALYGQWLPHSGYEMRDAPALEFYLNDPRKTAREDLLTEIYAPVRKST